MNMRRFRRDSVDVNLTPLIDVVFLLLIFFMVSTTFDRSAELAIELPEATEGEVAAPSEAIDVAIDAKGRYFVNGQVLVDSQLVTLKTAMSDLLKGGEPPPIVINADANTTHQSVIVVMDAARQLGLAKVRFTTRAAQ